MTGKWKKIVLEGELKIVVAERDREVSAMESSVKEHNTNQVNSESLKSANN